MLAPHPISIFGADGRPGSEIIEMGGVKIKIEWDGKTLSIDTVDEKEEEGWEVRIGYIRDPYNIFPRWYKTFDIFDNGVEEYLHDFFKNTEDEENSK